MQIWFTFESDEFSKIIDGYGIIVTRAMCFFVDFECNLNSNLTINWIVFCI